MARVGTTSPVNGRGSPSEVFSTNIRDMENQKKLAKQQSYYKWFAIICAVLCVLFMLATIGLAIALGIKIRNQGDVREEQPDIENSPHKFAHGPMDNPLSDGQVAPLRPRPLKNKSKTEYSFDWPEPTGSLYSSFKRASIATDHGYCSEIGRNTLMVGGNAVDAMISSLLCIGVVNPQSSGLGGGFQMTLYNSTTKKCISIDARETAPSSANSTMFVGRVEEAFAGYRAIATPGELHGYWTVFQNYGSGRVTWKQLFEPSIKLAREGFPVSANLAMIIKRLEADVLKEPSLRKTFTDPETGKVFEEGDMMKRELLADTYEELANATDPIELFYRGGIAQTIAAEIQEGGGHVSADDLANYETIISETPLESEVLPGEIMCGPPPPSSFAVTQSIIGVMAQFYNRYQENDIENDPLIYHRLIEAEKFAYAVRAKLGDIAFVPEAKKMVYNMTKPSYVKWIASMIKNVSQPFSYYMQERSVITEDHGTSHVVVIDVEGNAISTTSTVNQYFGARRVSPTLGIIWNDEMDDFSTPGSSNAFGFPPSPANFIEPGKRPMSSMSPTIIYNKKSGKVKMVVGVSGGSRIISAVAQTVIRTLLFNQTVKEAIDAPRFHNQYMPYVTEYELPAPPALIDVLTNVYKQNFTGVVKQPSVTQALLVGDDGYIHGNSDFRRQTATYPAGF